MITLLHIIHSAFASLYICSNCWIQTCEIDHRQAPIIQIGAFSRFKLIVVSDGTSGTEYLKLYMHAIHMLIYKCESQKKKKSVK